MKYRIRIEEKRPGGGDDDWVENVGMRMENVNGYVLMGKTDEGHYEEVNGLCMADIMKMFATGQVVKQAVVALGPIIPIMTMLDKAKGSGGLETDVEALLKTVKKGENP